MQLFVGKLFPGIMLPHELPVGKFYTNFRDYFLVT